MGGSLAPAQRVGPSGPACTQANAHSAYLQHEICHPKQPGCNAGEVDSGGAEFLVKWVGRSHLHNEWVPQGQLVRLAKRKLVNFKRRYGATPCNFADAAWTRVRLSLACLSTLWRLSAAWHVSAVRCGQTAWAKACRQSGT